MARLLTAPRVEREQIYPRIDAENEAVDVLLTGFRGSGKTTRLARLVRHPAMAGAAVVINELGEVGIGSLARAALL